MSPLIYWEEMNNSNSPPSYTEAITTPVAMRPATLAQEKKKELKLKLCRLEKTSAGFGFRLNGVQGLYGQHIKEVRVEKTSAVLNVTVYNKWNKKRFVSGGEGRSSRQSRHGG